MMQPAMYSAIQPLSSYNPFSIGKGQSPQSVKQNASAGQIDSVGGITEVKKQLNTVDGIKLGNQSDNQGNEAVASSFEESVLFFDESAIKSAVNAKVEYDHQTSSHAQQHHSQGSTGAIKEYLLNQHAAQRDQIQQMVGIDLYA